jgi:predicted RNA binding protein YcfA (HicA-like mRNA interferase family)
MKPLPPNKIIKILEANGFVNSRQKGSHVIMRDSRLGTIVPVPVHKRNRQLAIGTFQAIIKQSGLGQKKFRT